MTCHNLSKSKIFYESLNPFPLFVNLFSSFHWSRLKAASSARADATLFLLWPFEKGRACYFCKMLESMASGSRALYSKRSTSYDVVRRSTTRYNLGLVEPVWRGKRRALRRRRKGRKKMKKNMKVKTRLKNIKLLGPRSHSSPPPPSAPPSFCPFTREDSGH